MPVSVRIKYTETGIVYYTSSSYDVNGKLEANDAGLIESGHALKALVDGADEVLVDDDEALDRIRDFVASQKGA